MIEPCEPTGSTEFDEVRAAKWRIQMGQEDNCSTLKCQSVPVIPSEYGWHRAALPSPSQPFLHSFLCLPVCSSTQELLCITEGILQLHSLQYRSLSAMIPYNFTVPNLSKLSSSVTPQIQSCFPSTFLPHLTAPQLLLLLFAYFKSQQKSWFRTPWAD